MRKALLSIAAVALLSTGVSAQAYLTDTSFFNPVGTTDTFRYISSGYNSGTTADPDDIRLPRPTGFVWYFQGLSYNYTKAPRFIQHITATGFDYANKTIDTLNHKTHTTTAPQWVYMPEYLTDITPGVGIEEHGINIPTAFGYSLSSLPLGTAMDSLKIPAQVARYYETTISNNLEQRIKLKFPVTNTTATWVNTYQDTIHGTIRYAAGGLIDTPFHIKTEVLETKDVAGYGKLRFRKPTYLYNPLQFNDTFNILQVRCTLQMKDYYMIGNNLADSTTLSFIGVNGQGTTRLYYYDEYYRRRNVEPVLTFRFTDVTFQNASSNLSDAHLSSLNPTEVAEITNLSNINVYPNPAKGGVVNVDINGGEGNWTYDLYNVNGQWIKSGSLANNKGNNKVQLPAQLAVGSYFMILENGEESVVKKLTIAE